MAAAAAARRRMKWRKDIKSVKNGVEEHAALNYIMREMSAKKQLLGRAGSI